MPRLEQEITMVEVALDAARSWVTGSLGDFAGKLVRLFRLTGPAAPGLVFIGGEIDPTRIEGLLAEPGTLSLAGAGRAIEQAMAACLGEGVERLSQFERPDEAIVNAGVAEIGARAGEQMRAWLDRHRHDLGWEENRALDWVPGICLADGEPVLVPADLCLRRPRDRRALGLTSPLSTGCAAGPTPEAARLRALLELVERDAVALWWIGGRRALPLALEAPALQGAIELIAALRQGRPERTSWLLDITTDLGIPSVAAVSVDADGSGLACGFAARLSLPEAARSALLEMCQMELANLIVETKRRARGESALNPVDRNHLRRARLNVDSCALLHPQGLPAAPVEIPDAPAAQGIRTIAGRLSLIGADAYLVDLTRPVFGISVAHAVVPALQPMPSTLRSPRLRGVIAQTGGGAPAADDFSLL
jgi:ribosomal protein S12 methylthiotransferase accessory factor